MNRKKLLLQLLPGFIPLFVFIVADEIWGTNIGLIVAVALGIIELCYYRIKDGKFDRFILLDTLLIIVLGIVSIILENEIFFKIKPALIGMLFCIVLGISAFSPKNILFNMSKRYMKGIDFNEEQQHQMQKSTRVMFWLFAGYTLLVLYSTRFMSNEAWAFISGGFLYILFGGYFVFEFAKARIIQNKLKKEEWLPLLNEKGEVIGKAPRSVCHSDKKYLHPVIHLHVINKNGEIYLQKRALNKKIQPGKWDTAVGGHIAFGETIETGLQREAFEELGIVDFKALPVANYIWESTVEREFVFCYVTRYDGGISPDKKEVADGKFWSLNEIEKNIGKGILTPNFEEEYRKIKVLKDNLSGTK